MSCASLQQGRFTASHTGVPVARSSNTSTKTARTPKHVTNPIDDEKWSGKLKALGMAQGTYPMENITSAKFRVFLAEKAINYQYIANVDANLLLTNTNIGCPNISFGPGTRYIMTI